MDNSQLDHAVTGQPGLHVHKRSVTEHEGAHYFLVDQDDGQQALAIRALMDTSYLTDFDATPRHTTEEHTLLLGPLNEQNAAALRDRLAWLQPTPQGLRTGVGLGDRLGLATPGHLRAVREVGGNLVPFPAQQSIREMARTGRTPQQVMDDAMWGVFAEGWRAGFGADADHLKTPEDIDRCLTAGYTFYTFDPGEHVDSTAEQTPPHALRARVAELPWERLEDSPEALAKRYLATPIHCEEHTIAFDEIALLRAALKYGRAIAHVALLYQHLAQASAGRPWEVEVSVDETETPTTHAEHVYIATELRRLGVHWVSLAPRYIGQFEKGVDYIGDVSAFERDISVHAAIARTLGPYKLSLHSGSDKFSIYEAAARQTRGMVHLKTAGTSYLEALRTIATLEPELLYAIYTFACERYERDRTSYHVSARLERAPDPAALSNAQVPLLLEQFDAREILHVTFGSVLTARMVNGHGHLRFYDQIMAWLRSYPEDYAANLQAHFLRHLRPFVSWKTR